MARTFKQKQQKEVYVPRDTLVGKVGDKEVKLFYNESTKRYDLTVDDVFEGSSVNHKFCLDRAEKLGVEWDKQTA